MPNITDQDLIAEFVVESLEHLADIESQLLAMESAGENIDADLVNTVFRAIHSAKGAAGFLGLNTISRLAHNMENILNLFRNRELVPTTSNIDVLLRCADVLRRLLGDTATSNEVDITEHVEALAGIASGARSAAPAAAPAAEPQAAPAAPAPAAPAPASAGQPPHTEDDEDSAELEQSTPAGTAATAAHNASSQPASGADSSKQLTGKSAADASIRVSVELLDDLMNLAGELVLSRNRLLQVVAARDTNQIDAVATGLDHVTADLQEAIMRTRMQTIGTVFSKFRRIVRDLSVKLGKDCQLLVEGEDVEVDKSIIESIGDPLTHLIRNSVDHGIEMPEQRVAQGKPAQGTIYLRAFHQAGKVHISITDDGRGIDAQKVKEKAVTRGLITPDQAREMSDQEAVRLIFQPGFSLAEKVSDVSGRGVGMDVVRSNIEKLSGTVSIETTMNAGTRIDVRLPLTLAIVPSLIVWCGARKFAIPQASINELVRIRAVEVAKRIEHVKNAEMFRLRGVLLPLVRLNHVLSMAPAPAPEGASSAKAVYIIVVDSGALRYGLVVDSVADSEEIVVKPLGHHIQESTCLAGATVLGDGTVAPILDVTGIATHMNLKVTSEDNTHLKSNEGETEETQTALILRNHPDEQFGVPMQLIARLERIRSDSVTLVGMQEVLQYRGGTLPLLRIENLITAQPPPPRPTVSVIVFTVAKREIGLIVPQLVDIGQIPTNVDTRTLKQRGILGSLIVQDTTTRLLNLYELAELAFPDWFTQTDAVVVSQERGPARLLVVEDSAFFRNQLTDMLQEVGYSVTGTEDGVEAWELLQQPEEHFDMVITDIEMPRMDGLALAQNIRNHAALSRLPIIAVTSLGSDADIQRGEAAGIDAYHIKLEREELLNTIMTHLTRAGISSSSPSLDLACAAY
ncbi:MAG: hybrid sensor histidine kinase/response regulator [Planctomycetaceae bacterium]|nr:hybrid sensor histidine kinase/response regulator [Planctomycetaceae bacterium]